MAKILDTSPSWQLNPYGVMVGQDFPNYEKALTYQLDVVTRNAEGSAKGSDLISKDKGMAGSSMIVDPESIAYSYKAPSVSDSSVGGNDVINPLSSFNEDDDIVHNIFKGSGSEWGMGRVYSEAYDQRQQVLYLTMGIPKYRNLTTWLKNATHKEMAELNDEGRISAWSKLGDFIKGGITLAIELPWLPIIWAHKAVQSIGTQKVTEYFAFRDTMPLYYRYVNTILSHIAVNMGIYGNGSSTSSGQAQQGNSKTTMQKATTGNGANMTPQQKSQLSGSNMPAVLKNGPDIFKIISRRAARLGKVTSEDTDKLLQAMNEYKDNPEEKVSMFRNFWSGLTTGAMEGGNFIGFRIDKVEAAETFSNSTQDSSLASRLNSEVQKHRDRDLNEQGDDFASTMMRWGTKAKEAVAQTKKFFSGGGLNDAIAYLAAGNGFFDLPKQWAGSAGMSRSLSFTMKLRARTGGDNVSIFQSIMIPIACLLAAALPRAIGDSTYTSPFIVRAFCKGMFCVPAGLITSLSITRGSSEFGWTLNKLPTCADVSFTVEDLSPMLFLSMAGNGLFKQAFTNNTKMHEYLATLSGIGLKERYFRLGQIKRQWQAAWLASRNTTFSATYRGYAAGDSKLVRAIMSLTPYHRVPNN